MGDVGTPLADAALKQQDDILTRLFGNYQQEIGKLNPGVKAGLTLDDFKAGLHDQYLRQARDNRVRALSIQAPRGAVLDRNGDPLVENRVATVVKLDPERLPVAERDAAARWGQQLTARSRRPKGEKDPLIPIPRAATPGLVVRFRRLGRALNMSPRTIQERVVRSLTLVSYASVTMKTAVRMATSSMKARLTPTRK